MQVSQKHIADQLKLSVSTVSKSLRNSSEIPPQTRAQVLELASVLGYRPVSARADRQKDNLHTHASIGVLIQSDTRIGASPMQHATEVLMGATELAQASEISVNVHYVPLADRDRILDPEFQPIAMRQRKLSGLILVHYFSPAIVEALARQLPVVTISHRCTGVDCIDADQIGAMIQLVDHLYALGHRRIGFLAGLNHQTWLHGRFAGYIQALAQHGLQFDPTIADIKLDTTFEDAAVTQHIAQLTRGGVTAWICGWDLLGYSWMERLARAGIRVPEDVSLVGVDAVPNSPQRLTSIRVPSGDMGRAAVIRLMARIRNPVDPYRVIQLGGTLVAGNTTRSLR